MSGRGGGRGRGGRGGKRGGQTHLNIEALGISQLDKMAPTAGVPPPLFPPYDKKPLQLSSTEYDQLLLAKKQYLREAYKETQFYLKTSPNTNTHHNIDRYTDKYIEGGRRGHEDTLSALISLVPLWERRLPKELHPKTKKLLKKGKGGQGTILAKRLKANITTTNSSKLSSDGQTASFVSAGNIKQENDTSLSLSLINNQLNALEKQEGGVTTATAGSGDEEDDDVPLEEEYDEELEEEQGDYQLTYFDPGDDIVSDDEENVQSYY